VTFLNIHDYQLFEILALDLLMPIAEFSKVMETTSWANPVREPTGLGMELSMIGGFVALRRPILWIGMATPSTLWQATSDKRVAVHVSE
ncbi:MAG TPA: hypothetical protein VFK31_00600, partial [Rhodanobacteraceae bacterium]|nr:hypothetical protein [Rhodanobacteraceae bacterium]